MQTVIIITGIAVVAAVAIIALAHYKMLGTRIDTAVDSAVTKIVAKLKP